jgi:hypothetical protein
VCIEIDERVIMACFKFWLPWRDHMRRIYVLVWWNSQCVSIDDSGQSLEAGNREE